MQLFNNLCVARVSKLVVGRTQESHVNITSEKRRIKNCQSVLQKTLTVMSVSELYIVRIGHHFMSEKYIIKSFILHLRKTRFPLTILSKFEVGG